MITTPSRHARLLALALPALTSLLPACGGGSGEPQCRTAADCAGIAVVSCQVAACVQGACTSAPSPAGTAQPDPTPGDCQGLACDGGGATMSVPDDGDLPADDGNPCTSEICSAGTPSHPPVAAGTVCPAGVCNGAGSCVQCLVGADCGAGVCIANACFAASCQDMMKNGNETDVDCGGGLCPACAQGKMCILGGDCRSGVCSGNVCGP